MAAIRWRVEEFASIDSTNTYLVQRARAGENAGLVARADFQTAGRGRLDRRWDAPARSSLLTSLLLAVPDGDRDRALLPVLVALSARAALVRLCGVRPDLKWPNDLVVDGRKIGGVLAELVADRAPRMVVVGIGVNLTFAGPPEANGTCVRDLAGVTLEPSSVLDLLLEECESRLIRLHNEPDLVRDEWRRALVTLGTRVRVERTSDVIEGVARDIDAEGCLLVETNHGVIAVSIGDVTHLRPATETT